MLRSLIFFSYLITLFTLKNFNKVLTKKTIIDRNLIIKTDALGDLIIWLDQYKQFANSYDHIIVDDNFVTFVKQLKLFEKVYGIPKPKKKLDVFKLFVLFSKFQKYNYSRIINAQINREKISDFLCLMITSNCKIRTSIKTSNQNFLENLITSTFYTDAVKFGESDKIQHISFLDKQFLAQIFKEQYDIPDLSELFSESCKKYNLGNNYAVISHGGSDYRKQFDAKQFGQISDFLLEQLNIENVILVGTNSEIVKSKQIIKNSKNNFIINLTGKTNIFEYCSVISGAKLVISNDSSAGHIAKITNTPSISIVGGGNFGIFYPYQDDKNITIFKHLNCFGCNWNCKYKLINSKFKCISTLHASQIYKAISVNFPELQKK